MYQDPVTRLKILFLPRWYPHRYDPMPGLFIQRQAQAVSEHCDVSVLYVHDDPQCLNNYDKVVNEENGINIVRVYYRRVTCPGMIGKLFGLYRFFMATWLGFRMLRNFSPDLLHVHVLTRQGLIALIYKLFTRTPYMITEHWSRYFPQNNTYTGLLRKVITRIVVHFASGIITVSGKLKKALMDKNLYNRNYWVIPNPVDMNKFRITKDALYPKPLKKRLIHISCFEDKSKNISGFLNAIKRLSLKRDDFECFLIGVGPEWEQLKAIAKDLDLFGKIAFFPGMKEQDDLVAEINKSDFLVLSSQYETFGSVIIESFACGIPVVAANVGVVSDVVNEQNGLIIPPGDETALEVAMAKMLEKCREYDKFQIRECVVDRFSNKIIGEQLYNIYKEVLVYRY